MVLLTNDEGMLLKQPMHRLPTTGTTAWPKRAVSRLYQLARLGSILLGQFLAGVLEVVEALVLEAQVLELLALLLGLADHLVHVLQGDQQLQLRVHPQTPLRAAQKDS